MEHKAHKKDLVNAATYSTTSDAERLKSWLKGEGIQAEILDETRLQKFWFMATPKAGIHVQVPRDQFERVAVLLQSEDTFSHLQSAVRCPSCGSLRVQYPDLTRKSVLPTLIPQLLVLLHITRHKYYCEDCHFTWPNVPKHPPHRRPAHWRFLKDLPSVKRRKMRQ